MKHSGTNTNVIVFMLIHHHTDTNHFKGAPLVLTSITNFLHISHKRPQELISSLVLPMARLSGVLGHC